MFGYVNFLMCVCIHSCRKASSLQEDVWAIMKMLTDGVDTFGEEPKMLSMFMVTVAEQHGRKKLATRLVKVNNKLIMTCNLTL